MSSQFRDTYLIHVAHDDYTHSAFLTQLAPVVGEEAEAYKKHRAEYMKIRATTTTTAQVGREILAGRSVLADYRSPLFSSGSKIPQPSAAKVLLWIATRKCWGRLMPA